MGKLKALVMDGAICANCGTRMKPVGEEQTCSEICQRIYEINSERDMNVPEPPRRSLLQRILGL